MVTRLALTVIVALCAGSTGRPLIAQSAIPPRQVAIDWLTAKRVVDAVRHLPPASVEQVRAFQKTATPEQAVVVGLLEMMLAPLPFARQTGSTLTVTGSPVSTISMSGSETIRVTVLAVSVTGDTATVPLRVRARADDPEEAGSIQLGRDGAVWRILAASLGSRIPLVRFDSPNYLHAATSRIVEELERERANNTLAVVIGRLRTLQSAQLVYAAYNGGFFAPTECLAHPKTCNTPFKIDTPPLPEGSLDLRGYESRFYPGPKPSASEIGGGAPSLKSWAHVFTPTDAASQLPRLCGDSTGRICRLPAGRSEISGGVCPAACVDVK